mmetsp:Transcript_39993/g.125622  ORF Transcript_39993/g.125622 Transcript_39993/m.125622 type:complete len:239 (-) Transcript_39993:190-906(-)
MDDDYTCMYCDGGEGEHVDDELICPDYGTFTANSKDDVTCTYCGTREEEHVSIDEEKICPYYDYCCNCSKARGWAEYYYDEHVCDCCTRRLEHREEEQEVIILEEESHVDVKEKKESNAQNERKRKREECIIIVDSEDEEQERTASQQQGVQVASNIINVELGDVQSVDSSLEVIDPDQVLLTEVSGGHGQKSAAECRSAGLPPDSPAEPEPLTGGSDAASGRRPGQSDGPGAGPGAC